MSDRLRRPVGAPLPEDGCALLLFVGLLVWVFAEVALGGEVFYRRDVNMTWLPQVEAFVRAVGEGAWPVWDPSAGFGRPLLADPRAEVLYPPTWLNLLLVPTTYYGLFVFGHLLFAGYGQYRLARSWGVSALAASVAGAAWMLAGPLVSLVSMWHQLAAAAWLPWLLLSAERALDGGIRDRAVCAVVLAAQFLAGSPDTSALSVGFVAVYLGLRAWQADTGTFHGLGRAAIAGVVTGVLALGLTAAQWLPTRDVARQSLRWADQQAAAPMWSLHPAALAELAAPVHAAELPLRAEWSYRLLGGPEPLLASVYLGLPVLALALLAVAAGVSRARAVAWPAAGMLLLALGPHTPLLGWLRHVPGVAALRYPSKALLLVAFAVSLLAALGVDAWNRCAPRLRAGVVVGLAAGVVAEAALAVALWQATSGNGWVGPFASGEAAAGRAGVPVARLFVAALAGSGALIALGWRRGRPAAWAAACLAAWIVVDLGAAHRHVEPTAPAAVFAIRPEALDVLGPDRPLRVYVYDYSMRTRQEIRTSRGRPWAYRLARIPEGFGDGPALVIGTHLYLNPPTASRWGIDGSFDLDLLDFDPPAVEQLAAAVRELDGTPAYARLLRLGGVDAAVSLHDQSGVAGLVPEATLPGLFREPIRIYRVEDPLPRAYAVRGVRIARARDVLGTLLDPSFDPRREVVLTAGTEAPAAAPPGQVRLVERKADRLSLEARLDAPGLVVVLERNAPGWRASLDGRPVPMLTANRIFRAVAVEAGFHRIEMAYRPRPLLAGLLASGASGLVVIGMLWWGGGRGARTKR